MKTNKLQERFEYVQNSSTFDEYKNDMKIYEKIEKKQSQYEICYFQLEETAEPIPPNRQEIWWPSLEPRPGNVFLSIITKWMCKIYEVNLKELAEILPAWMDMLLAEQRDIMFYYPSGLIENFTSTRPHPFSLIKGKYEKLFMAIINYDNLKLNRILKSYHFKEFNGQYAVSVHGQYDLFRRKKDIQNKLINYINQNHESVFLCNPSIKVFRRLIFNNLFDYPVKYNYDQWYIVLFHIITLGLANKEQQTPWNKFLTKGLYDPRLFLLISAFASYITSHNNYAEGYDILCIDEI